MRVVEVDVASMPAATVVGLAIYGGNKAAGGNAGMIRRRQIGGAGLERVAGRFKTWFQDFF